MCITLPLRTQFSAAAHAISELDVNNGLGDRYEAYHLLFQSLSYFEAIVELYTLYTVPIVTENPLLDYRHDHGNNGTQTRIEPLVKQTGKFIFKVFSLFLFLLGSICFFILLVETASGQIQWLIVVFHRASIVIQPQLGVLAENENTSAVCYYKSALIEKTELAKRPRMGFFFIVVVIQRNEDDGRP